MIFSTSTLRTAQNSHQRLFKATTRWVFLSQMIWDTDSFSGEIEPQWCLSDQYDRSAEIKICRFQLLINLPRSGCWPDLDYKQIVTSTNWAKIVCSLSREIDRSFCILLRNKLSLFRRFCNPRITQPTSKMQGSTKLMTAVSGEPCWQELRSPVSTHSRRNDGHSAIVGSRWTDSSLPVLWLEKSLLIFYWLWLNSLQSLARQLGKPDLKIWHWLLCYCRISGGN